VVAGARLVLTMINFRFHLVSLIAVFLALGLGILVGSTVVDQVIVDRLDRSGAGEGRVAGGDQACRLPVARPQ